MCDERNTYNVEEATTNLAVDINIPPPLSDIQELTEETSSTLVPKDPNANAPIASNHTNKGMYYVNYKWFPKSQPIYFM